MAKKKTSSIFFEPYNLLMIVVQGAALFFSSIVQAFKDIRSESKKPADPGNVQGKAAYVALSAQFENPDFEQNWRGFLLRVLCVQALLLFLTISHVVFGNWFISLQLLVILLASIVLFGYKPWVRRNKRVVSFITYVRQEVWKDPKSMILWLHLKEKQ